MIVGKIRQHLSDLDISEVNADVRRMAAAAEDVAEDVARIRVVAMVALVLVLVVAIKLTIDHG